jgi:hypothetical protein
MAGRATIIEEPVYGTRKLEREVTRRMIFFSRSSTMRSSGVGADHD